MATLQRRSLGRSNIEVPVVGIGCNNFGGRIDEQRSERVILAALDAGAGFFDTADIYGRGRSEEILGRVLGPRRDEAVIATKFGGDMPGKESGGGSRRWIEQAVEDSLRRLRTDRIDLYQHHFPDDATPLEETLEALDRLVRAGKVRAIGSSNYSAEQITRAHDVATANAWSGFITAQNQYSLLDRAEVEDSITPVCERLGIGIIPFFPLANGLLSGKYRRGQGAPEGSRLAGMAERSTELLTDSNFDVIESLEDFASQRGVTLLDVAIGGLAAQSCVVSVIAGATSPEQVAANARAGEWMPSAEDLAAIDRITRRPARV